MGIGSPLEIDSRVLGIHLSMHPTTFRIRQMYLNNFQFLLGLPRVRAFHAHASIEFHYADLPSGPRRH